jgi:hypothetical protein
VQAKGETFMLTSITTVLFTNCISFILQFHSTPSSILPSHKLQARHKKLLKEIIHGKTL